MANHPVNITRGVSFHPAAANAERVARERREATRAYGRKLDQVEQAYREREEIEKMEARNRRRGRR